MISGKKICIIGPDLNISGGVATHVRNLKSLKVFESARVIDLGSRTKGIQKSMFSIFSSLFKMRKTIQSENYRRILINSSVYPFAFAKLLLTLFFLLGVKNIKTYVFFHGGRFANSKVYTVPGIHFLFDKLLQQSESIYFLSTEQLTQFKERFPNCRAQLYRNYSSELEAAKDKKIRSEKLKFLFVGRLLKSKGLEEILTASIRLEKTGNTLFEITFVGDGEDGFLIENARRELKNKDLLVEKGFLQGQSLLDAYAYADVLLLPSHHEGFPYVVIEALQNRLPVIATKTGALDVMLTEGKTGFLIQISSIEQLIEAMNKIMDDRQLLDTMSDYCSQSFSEFYSTQKAEEFYRLLLSEE